MLRCIALAVALFALPAMAAEDASILNPSGLKIPRFVSLKSNEVNARVGPGKRYPIRYVYKREHLPVEIVEEFAHWRKIKDYEGSTGWVHKGLLDGTRTVLIMDKPQNLYARPEVTSQPIIRAAPMVVAALRACELNWCKVEIHGQEAWIRKSDIWGVYRDELLDD